MPNPFSSPLIRDLGRLALAQAPAYCPDPGHYRSSARHLRKAAGAMLGWKMRARLAGRRVVVIALCERMGDIAACEPVVAAVRRRHPDDVVLWVVRPPFAELLRGNPGLDGLVEVRCITEWIYLARLPLHDISYDLHINGKPCESGCGTILKKRGGDPGVDGLNYYDHGPLLVAFSRAAGLDLDPSDLEVAPRLPAPPLPERLVRDLPTGPFVCFHARSEEDARNWNLEGWRSLAAHAWREHGLAVVEIGGPDSSPPISTGGFYRDFRGRCSMTETVALIRRASLFVGIDSGPAHLANASGTPGLILLGLFRKWATYMPYTGPYADPGRATILRHHGPVGELPVEVCLAAFDEAARKFLAPTCAPAGQEIRS